MPPRGRSRIWGCPIITQRLNHLFGERLGRLSQAVKATKTDKVCLLGYFAAKASDLHAVCFGTACRKSRTWAIRRATGWRGTSGVRDCLAATLKRTAGQHFGPPLPSLVSSANSKESRVRRASSTWSETTVSVTLSCIVRHQRRREDAFRVVLQGVGESDRWEGFGRVVLLCLRYLRRHARRRSSRQMPRLRCAEDEVQGSGVGSYPASSSSHATNFSRSTRLKPTFSSRRGL